MKLNELSPSVPKKNRKRIGRGNSSGWGKTAGKGSNGQKFKKEYTVISLAFLNENFEDGEEVSLETLFNKCLIKKGRDGVKVLGNGELNKKLTVKVHKISKSAKAAVEAKGGTVELVEVKGFERAESNK